MVNITATNWWQPAKPDKVLPGALLEEDEHGWVLQLDGTFQEPPVPDLSGKPTVVTLESPDSFPVLVGTTSHGKLISLFNCQVLECSFPFGGSRGALKVWPAIIVHGVHFESAEDFRLSSLSIRFTNLDTWVATSGFTVKWDAAFDPLEVRYSKPESIDVIISDGLKVGVGFSSSVSSLQPITNIRIVQQSWLTATSVEDVSYEHLLRQINNLADLVSLGVGAPLRPLEMVGVCNARDGLGNELPVSVTLVSNREPIAPDSPDTSHWEMLFTLPNVRSRFGDLVVAWFSRDEVLQSLYDLYFGTLRSPTMYVEHRFINLFQALESYDRRTFKDSPEKLQKHKDRLDRVVNSVDVKDREWVERNLRNSHEAAAADRIKRLAKKLDAGWLLSNPDIDLAGNFRNYYTHFDSRVEQRLPPKEKRHRTMHNLAVRLRVLCELVLLDAINFPREEAQNRMQKTRRVERRLVSL